MVIERNIENNPFSHPIPTPLHILHQNPFIPYFPLSKYATLKKFGGDFLVRSIEITKISFNIKNRNKEEVIKKIRKLFGKGIEIYFKQNELSIKGDLHNHKKRKELIKYLIGEEYGQSL